MTEGSVSFQAGWLPHTVVAGEVRRDPASVQGELSKRSGVQVVLAALPCDP